MSMKKFFLPVLSFSSAAYGQGPTHVGRWWGDHAHISEQMRANSPLHRRLDTIPEHEELTAPDFADIWESDQMSNQEDVESRRLVSPKKEKKEPKLESIPEDEEVHDFATSTGAAADVIERDSKDLEIQKAELEALLEYHKFLEEL